MLTFKLPRELYPVGLKHISDASLMLCRPSCPFRKNFHNTDIYKEMLVRFHNTDIYKEMLVRKPFCFLNNSYLESVSDNYDYLKKAVC